MNCCLQKRLATDFPYWSTLRHRCSYIHVDSNFSALKSPEPWLPRNHSYITAVVTLVLTVQDQTHTWTWPDPFFLFLLGKGSGPRDYLPPAPCANLNSGGSDLFDSPTSGGSGACLDLPLECQVGSVPHSLSEYPTQCDLPTRSSRTPSRRTNRFWSADLLLNDEITYLWSSTPCVEPRTLLPGLPPESEVVSTSIPTLNPSTEATQIIVCVCSEHLYRHCF